MSSAGSASEENISQELEKESNNMKLFQIFNHRMKQKGFELSVEQCHVKVKMLRQHYRKICDTLHIFSYCGKNGSGKAFDKLAVFLVKAPYCRMSLMKGLYTCKTVLTII